MPRFSLVVCLLSVTCCLSAIGSGLICSAAAAEPVVASDYECRWANGPVEIDGKSDELAWKAAQPIEKFGSNWLGEKAQASKTTTKARLLWDREYLYFFADLEDHDLFADVKEHDGKCWDNDVFELFFRPSQEKPAYYEFQVNALGTKFDSIMPKGNKTFEEIVKDGTFAWKTAVVRRGTLDNRQDRDLGWSVEGRIPWSDLARTGGAPKAGDTWRFALCRYDYTLGQEPELSSCAPLTERSFHQTEHYAKLKFVAADAALKTGRIEKRIPLTTSKVVGSPDPPLPYRPVRAFPQLKLTYPIALDRVPGTDTLLIIAQGKSYGATTIYKIKDDPAASIAEPLLETPGGGTAYGICFHPKFAENSYLYVGWNGSLNKEEKKTYATRYTFDRQTQTIDPKSELHVISWESNGHNGGDVEFGLDGMFYVTSGDGTSDSDTNLRGQDLTKHTAKLLRIDVDHPADGKPYSVPADNPFVGQKGIVPETWAYGFRNPWRLAVDPKTGHIWVGNNGQDIWEQIFFVRKADNFGWSVYEGSHPFYLNRTMGPQPLALPAAEHHHNEARSLTGGVVYYGSKLPELVGAYIYGDHSTGKIWAIKHDGTKVTWHQQLADTTFNIPGFGLDSHGELLVADHHANGEGAFYYLEKSPEQPPSTFPRKLSDSGLFVSVKDHVLQPGVIPYSVNAALWSDGAYKERYFAIPEKAAADYKINLNAGNGWDFPDETVLIKSFALETTAGDPSSRQWIETRFLTKQAGEWVGYSYAWNADHTDAELVGAGGLDREFGKQKWHYPSRTECMVCHSRAANFVLGLSTAQMNKAHDYGGGAVEEQFDVLERLEFVKGRKPADAAKLPKLVDPYDTTQPLEARARSYLHANCAICHIDAGGGNSQVNFSHNAKADKFNAIDVAPLHHKFGIENARIIAPGDPARSVLLYRLSRRGENSGQMPQLATNVVDEAAVKLFTEWIQSLSESKDAR